MNDDERLALERALAKLRVDRLADGPRALWFDGHECAALLAEIERMRRALCAGESASTRDFRFALWEEAPGG